MNEMTEERAGELIRTKGKFNQALSTWVRPGGAAIWKSWIENSITTPVPINPIERLFQKWSKASVRTVGAVYDRI